MERGRPLAPALHVHCSVLAFKGGKQGDVLRDRAAFRRPGVTDRRGGCGQRSVRRARRQGAELRLETQNVRG